MHAYTQHVSPVLLRLLVKECNFIFLKIVHIMKMLSYYVVSPASPNQKKKKKKQKELYMFSGDFRKKQIYGWW